MASWTVRIFSASSSGISTSKASSRAMTSSTVSSESAPKSSTNEALGVTSPSSTPSCSEMICFTFSTDFASAISLRLPMSLKEQLVYWGEGRAVKEGDSRIFQRWFSAKLERCAFCVPTLDVALLHLTHEEVTRPHTKGHDSHLPILPRI